ncbi:response regulator transcription factor [Nocardioides salsibiostraticola]
MPTGDRVRVAIANDYEIVVAGVAAALASYSDRIEVVELDAGVAPSQDVDVVLYDTFGQAQGGSIDMSRLAPDLHTRLVIFSWNVDDHLVQQTLELGAAGYVAKTVSTVELVEAIERVHRGESVSITGGWAEDFGRWPGDQYGLSNREAEVLALITQGYSNLEICERTFISNNTLKTYVRGLYRKIEVSRRSQAVLWGVEHGFSPDHVRHRKDL